MSKYDYMSQYHYYMHTGPHGKDSVHFNRVLRGERSSQWCEPPLSRYRPWRDYGYTAFELDQIVANGHGRKLCVAQFKRECEKHNVDWRKLL